MTNTSMVAIDYSMTSPAMIICRREVISFPSCQCFFLTDKPKLAKDFRPNLVGTLMPKWETFEERFDLISQWVFDNLPTDCKIVGIEGYSFGSKGKVFQIAENTGLLKHKFWKQQIPMKIVAPTEIKKFATGKGNATKQLLEECFVAQTGVNLREILGQSEKQMNPSSDIIDSFFLLSLIYNNITANKQ